MYHWYKNEAPLLKCNLYQYIHNVIKDQKIFFTQNISFIRRNYILVSTVIITRLQLNIMYLYLFLYIKYIYVSH